MPLPTGACGAWIGEARRLDRFLCDAVFRIEPSIYVGPDNGAGSLDWDTANIRLPPVDLARRHVDQVTTAELLGREASLISHYRRLVDIAERHGKAAGLRPFPYFRIQPAIGAGDEVLTEFAWTDDLHETRTVLEALAESGHGVPRLLHDDQDQGWHILIAKTAAAACFIEWDADGPPPPAGGYTVDAAALSRQASAALERLAIIHARLVEALGQDYWTYRAPLPQLRPTNALRAGSERFLKRVTRWFA